MITEKIGVRKGAGIKDAVQIRPSVVYKGRGVYLCGSRGMFIGRIPKSENRFGSRKN